VPVIFSPLIPHSGIETQYAILSTTEFKASTVRSSSFPKMFGAAADQLGSNLAASKLLTRSRDVKRPATSDHTPQAFDRMLGRRAQQRLEFGKDVFDPIEVGAFGREIKELRAGHLDRFAHFDVFVAAKIIHDDSLRLFKSDVGGRA
jgi:hypothetical protein